MRDRDVGGWAAEWNRERGDFQYWSNLKSQDWMNNIQNGGRRRPSTASAGGRKRAQSANPFGKRRPEVPIVRDASQVARNNNPEMQEKLRNDPSSWGQPMAQSFQLDPTYPPTDLKFNQPIANQNPALLRVAGKTSSQISVEKNKQNLFENLENINERLISEMSKASSKNSRPKTASAARAKGIRIRKSSSRSNLSKGSRTRTPLNPEILQTEPVPARRSFSSQGNRRSSQSSQSSRQSNGLRNSQALLAGAIYQGPPYAI